MIKIKNNTNLVRRVIRNKTGNNNRVSRGGKQWWPSEKEQNDNSESHIHSYNYTKNRNRQKEKV